MNPSEAESNEEREKKFAELEQRGTLQLVYEKDKEGKAIQKNYYLSLGGNHLQRQNHSRQYYL